jgi:hypothetical protein
MVNTYSARPAELASQMPWGPVSVFRASAGPKADERAADGLAGDGLAAAEPGTAEADAEGGRLVVVASAAAGVLLLDALLQAAATIATAASVRPKPALRTEVLQRMMILPGGRADPPAARTP